MKAIEFVEFMEEHDQSRVVVEVPETEVKGKYGSGRNPTLPNRFIVMVAWKEYSGASVAIDYVALDTFERKKIVNMPNDFIINPITDETAIKDLQKYDDVVGSLEREFEAIVKAHMPAIKAKLKEAEKALDEAVKIADNNGIPFHSPVSGLSQSYKPQLLHDKKWSKLSKEFVGELTDAYIDEYHNTGWQQSAIC